MRDHELEKRCLDMLMSSDIEMNELAIRILTHHFKSYDEYKRFKYELFPKISTLMHWNSMRFESGTGSYMAINPKKVVSQWTQNRLFQEMYKKFSEEENNTKQFKNNNQ